MCKVTRRPSLLTNAIKRKQTFRKIVLTSEPIFRLLEESDDMEATWDRLIKTIKPESESQFSVELLNHVVVCALEVPLALAVRKRRAAIEARYKTLSVALETLEKDFTMRSMVRIIEPEDPYPVPQQNESS